MFKRMFSSDGKKKDKKEDRRKQLQRSSTVASPERAQEEVKRDKEREEEKEKRAKRSSGNHGDGSLGKSSGDTTPKKSSGSKAKKVERQGSLKRRNKQKKEVQVDVSKPIDYPCVPEVILEFHKHKPFLKPNEEWLVVELSEFECLIDSFEIIQIMAKHSKFFELDPPEMVEEFFEFVDDVPSYDEVVNYDVWQEFRDKRYPC